MGRTGSILETKHAVFTLKQSTRKHPINTGVLRSKVGGEGGIRTPVRITPQDAFEAPPLRPLRYLSVRIDDRAIESSGDGHRAIN